MAAVDCSKNPNPAAGAGGQVKTVSVMFSIRTNQEFNSIAARAIVTVTAPDMDSISQSMVIMDSVMSATLHEVPVGKGRLFQIFVYDSSNIVRYYGSQQADIEPLATTYITIRLHKPTSGDVVITGIISDDTTGNVTVTAPSKPFALVTHLVDPDTDLYVFTSGNAWCSNGGHVEYGFIIVRNDSSPGFLNDSAVAQWGSGTVYRWIPFPGTYLVYARARSVLYHSIESAWSEPLIIKAVSRDSIVVLDTVVLVDTMGIDTTRIDTVWHSDTVIDSNDVYIIGKQDNGKTLNLLSGQYFKATFGECIGCAQVWRINRLDTAYIAFLNDSYSNPSCVNCAGGSHDRTFHFQAIKKGQSELEFVYFSDTVRVGINISR
jgi:hypothetical protein